MDWHQQVISAIDWVERDYSTTKARLQRAIDEGARLAEAVRKFQVYAHPSEADSAFLEAAYSRYMQHHAGNFTS